MEVGDDLDANTKAAPTLGLAGRYVIRRELGRGMMGVVYELEAPASRTIVAIKVREGHVEKLLEVEPGRHEVRVEVRWEDQHRVGTQLVDVAAGSTGLLEVQVARLTKELTLEWSRLAD